MRRSKLESYECILRVLASKSLIIDSLAYETNMDVAILKQRLEFLARNGLVEETNHKKKTYYGLTKKGAAVYRVFNLTTPLERLVIAARALDEALQTLPALSDYNGGREKRSRKNENY
ncbi:MAG: winged helix-turn-helix domain-containing protein [Candidatus Bathycorpusculaceae bacterium]